MAQEITTTVTNSITLQGQTASGNTTFRSDLGGDFLGEEQTIGNTSSALLKFGDMTSMSTLYIRNLDTTNSVQVDSTGAMSNFPQLIVAGAAILLTPQTMSIYAKASGAPVKVWIVAG
jgi:hypothetical protein